MSVKSESEVAQSCPTLRDPMDCSLPDSSIHGIFQASVLEWGAISLSNGILLQMPKQTKSDVNFKIYFFFQEALVKIKKNTNNIVHYFESWNKYDMPYYTFKSDKKYFK